MKTILIIFLACIALNCSKPAVPPRPKQIDERLYFPMVVGNKWEYIYIQDFGLEKLNSTIIGRWTQTVKITQESDEQFLFEEINYIGNLGAIGTQHIYELKNDMLMQAASGGGIQNLPMKPFDRKPILLKFPLRIDSSWEYEDDTDNIHHLKLDRCYDTISVLSKHFQNVIEVSDSVQDSKIEYKYYAYNVGLIKIEVKFIDPQTIRNVEQFRSHYPTSTQEFSRSVTFQLKSYDLKEQPNRVN